MAAPDPQTLSDAAAHIKYLQAELDKHKKLELEVITPKAHAGQLR